MRYKKCNGEREKIYYIIYLYIIYFIKCNYACYRYVTIVWCLEIIENKFVFYGILIL